MEIFTLNREYEGLDIIDEFESVIWTERYYGDSDFELVVPKKSDVLDKLPLGVLVGNSSSKELMILESKDIQEKTVKYKGISILPWLNNRFLRYTKIQNDLNGTFGTISNVGLILAHYIIDFASPQSPYLDASLGDDWKVGIPDVYLDRLKIPGFGLLDYGEGILDIPLTLFTAEYGPCYDSARKVATTYEVGMQVVWNGRSLSNTVETGAWQVPGEHVLGFRVYRGLDRTSQQDINPVVRFSPFLDSLTNVKELNSIEKYKNLAFSYMTNAPIDFTTTGIAYVEEASESSGFDLRVAYVPVDTIVDEPSDYLLLIERLKEEARLYLGANKFAKLVDGDILSTKQFLYGQDYNLGDLIELQGDTGTLSIGRITEYIRAIGPSGKLEYPTVSEIESINTTILSP